jgi:MFS family permease
VTADRDDATSEGDLELAVELLPGPPAPPPNRFAAAWNSRVGGLPRPFWYLWAGALVNRLGSFVEPFLVLYLTAQRGVSARQAGLLLAIRGAGGFVAQLAGGVLADRIGRRQTMLLGMVSFGASLLVLGFATALPLLVLGVVLTGLTADLYRPASHALVNDLVPAKDRVRAYGLHFWAINLGFAVATTLAGLVAESGYTWLFVGDAVTAVAFGVLVFRGVPETRSARARPDGEQGSVLTPFRDLPMVVLILSWLVYGSVYAQVFSTLPLAMREDGLSAAAFGVIAAANGVIIIVVQPLVVGVLARWPRVPTVAGSMALLGLGFGLTAFADTRAEYLLTVLVWTLGEIGAAGSGTAIVADLAPAHLRGRYAGAFGLAFAGAAVVGPLAGTWVFQSAGQGALWAGCFVVGLVAAGVQLSLTPVVRRRAARMAA